MEQLLSIKRIPIQVEVKVQRPELKLSEDYVPKQGTPSVQVSRGQNGSLCFKADPIKVDLSENRNYDAYVPSGNSGGFTLTYQAVAKLADSGSAQSANQSGEAARKFSAQRASRSIEAVLRSLPKSKHSPISYSDGKLSINYQVNNSQSGDLDDLAKNAPKFEFIPGSIEVIIKQMPGLDIEYLGDPIYFPRSADPNYEPLVDVTV